MKIIARTRTGDDGTNVLPVSLPHTARSGCLEKFRKFRMSVKLSSLTLSLSFFLSQSCLPPFLSFSLSFILDPQVSTFLDLDSFNRFLQACLLDILDFSTARVQIVFTCYARTTCTHSLTPMRVYIVLHTPHTHIHTLSSRTRNLRDHCTHTTRLTPHILVLMAASFSTSSPGCWTPDSTDSTNNQPLLLCHQENLSLPFLMGALDDRKESGDKRLNTSSKPSCPHITLHLLGQSVIYSSRSQITRGLRRLAITRGVRRLAARAGIRSRSAATRQGRDGGARKIREW